MKLEKVVEVLDLVYEMRLEKLENITVHLVGPPGIGKSAIVRKWAEDKARKLKKTFVDYALLSPDDVETILGDPSKYFVFYDCRITSKDPVDLSGVPRTVNGAKYVMFMPLAAAQLLGKCAGVLFLDEFLNESRPNMLSAAYQIVRDYKIGDIALSGEAVVVASSNSAEYSSLVGRLPKPLRSRFCFIEVEPPAVQSWIEWMDKVYPGKWDKNVAAYFLWKPSDFLANVDESVDDNGYEPPSDPRGVTYVALAFAKASDKELRRNIARGKLGKVGDSLMAFLENRVPSFKELCENYEQVTNYNVERKYLLAVTVAEALNSDVDNTVKAIPLLKFMARKDDREFLVALFNFIKRERRWQVFSILKNEKEITDVLTRAGQSLL
jgi:hypothetical protein